MTTRRRSRLRAAVPAVVMLVTLAGCAGSTRSSEAAADTAAKATAVIRASFKARGQAQLDRLDQDETQRACTEAGVKRPPNDVAREIEQANLATIKWPADGNFLGDWMRGEAIAQEGRGMQFSDDPKAPAGANCYACHQLSKEELAYGTIGPSLYNFGKLRGFTPEMQRYAYGKVYNAEAYSACTNMPRFGHKGILTEAQIKDVVALLMDPRSPVNQ